MKNESKKLLVQNTKINSLIPLINIHSNKDTNKSPEKTNNKFIYRKKNRINIRQLINNPDICHFNSQSHFIYDINEGTKYLSKVKNKIHLNSQRVKYLYYIHYFMN